METKSIRQGSEIQLRSEKMRKFIGAVPSILTRVSLLVNMLVFLMLALGVYYFYPLLYR